MGEWLRAGSYNKTSGSMFETEDFFVLKYDDSYVGHLKRTLQ